MTIQELLVYWRVIKKRLWLIALLVGTTVGTILLVAMLAKPTYRSTTSFQVTTPLPAEVALVTDFRTDTSRDELAYTRSNFLALIQSEFVAGEVASQLNLPMDAEELMKQVVIEVAPDSDFVHLRVVAQDPQQAADIANTLVETAAKRFAEMSSVSFTTNREVILRQLERRKAELDVARAMLVQFLIDNSIGSFEGVLIDQERLLTSARAHRDDAMAEGKVDVAANYDRIIVRREQELQERVQLSAKYDDLRLEVNRLETTYSNLLSKEIEAELKEDVILSAKFVRVIPARVPSNPLPRIDFRIVLIGVALSLAVGILVAFILEYMATHKETPASADQRPVTVLQTAWDPGKD